MTEHKKQIENVLCRGLENEKSLDIIFRFARLTSKDMKKALVYHLVNGAIEEHCCIVYGVEKSNFTRDLKKLNKIAKEIDNYLELNYSKYKSAR